MYDKVKLWLDRSSVSGEFSTIADNLSKAVEQTDRQTGETKVFGSLEGLKVSIYANGISIIGSLPKYLYASNVYPLDRHTTKEALTKMSDTLHTDVSRADVTGLEFGTVLLLSHRVESYLQRFGETPKLQRVHFEDGTLYYRSKSRLQPKTLAFYDKVAECKHGGVEMPTGLEGQNLLKYELRLNRRLPKQLNVREVKAATLTDREFYKALMQRWQNAYFSISKQKQVKTDVMSEIKTVSDAFDVLVARLISQSDKTQIQAFMEEIKRADVFKNRVNYTRLKKKIDGVLNKANFTTSDELIKELDDGFKNIGAYV